MKLLRYLKVLSVTIGSVAVVGALMVFALVPREALVDYLPALQGILPTPEANLKPVEPQAPTVAAVKKPKPVVALSETASELPPSDDEPVPQSEREKAPEQPVELAEAEIDLDDPQALERLSAEATNFDDLLVRKQRGVETAFDKDGSFTGWAKRFSKKNGQLEELGRYEDGLREGLWVEWGKDGRKRSQGHYQNGRQEGVWTHWKSNGVIAKEYTYVNGKKSRDKTKLAQDARRLKWREKLEERQRLRQERLPRK